MRDTPRLQCSNETRVMVNGVEYVVRSFYREDASETVEQKLLRLVMECVAAEIKHTEGVVSRSI